MLGRRVNVNGAVGVNEGSVFFPEGTGISEAKQERIKQLRAKRIVRITELNASPITDPGQQLLFTSNVLLTVPDESAPPEVLALPDDEHVNVGRAVGL